MQNPKNTSRSFFNVDSLSPAGALEHAQSQVSDFIDALPQSCAVDVSSMLVLENGLPKPGATHVLALLVIARISEEKKEAE